MSQLFLIFFLAFFSVGVFAALLFAQFKGIEAAPPESASAYEESFGASAAQDFSLSRLEIIVFRLAWPIVAPLAGRVQVICSAIPVSRQGRLLTAAGFDAKFSEAHWLAFRVMLSVMVATLLLVFEFLNDFQFKWSPLIGAIAALILANRWLRRRALGRRAELLDQLPFCIDLIVICIESGLNLSAAIEQTIRQGPRGALIRELQKIPARQRSGQSIRQSLHELASSCALPQIDSLVSSLVSAQASGSDLGPVLSALAQQIRDETYFEAEQRAMQAPVKMLVPLLLFVFPCTFLILLFPIGMRLMSEGILR